MLQFELLKMEVSGCFALDTCSNNSGSMKIQVCT
jgi:hypothetical protein